MTKPASMSVGHRPGTDQVGMDLQFSGELWYWRGPSPFHFVTVPEEESLDLDALSPAVSYGWGCIPVRARIGDTEWKTSLFPKDGRYIVPIKAAVRSAEGLDEGGTATVWLIPSG